jgi:hypothetical protein
MKGRMMCGGLVVFVMALICVNAGADPILFINFYDPASLYLDDQWSADVYPEGEGGSEADMEAGQGRTNQYCMKIDDPDSSSTCWVQSPYIAAIGDASPPYAMSIQIMFMFPDTSQHAICLCWNGIVSLWLEHSNNMWNLYYKDSINTGGQVNGNLGLQVNQWYDLEIVIGNGNYYGVYIDDEGVGVGEKYTPTNPLYYIYMGIQESGYGWDGTMFVDDIYVMPRTNPVTIANYWLFETFEQDSDSTLHGWGVTWSGIGQASVDSANVYDREDNGLHVSSPLQQNGKGYAWVQTTTCPILEDVNYIVSIDVGLPSAQTYNKFYILFNNQVALYVTSVTAGGITTYRLYVETTSSPWFYYVCPLSSGWHTIKCSVNLLIGTPEYDVYVDWPANQNPAIYNVPLYDDDVNDYLNFGDMEEASGDSHYGTNIYFDNIRIDQSW